MSIDWGPYLHAWWGWYLPACVEGLVVAAIILAMEGAFARTAWRWPLLRYTILGLVFIKLIFPPGVELSTGLIARFFGAASVSARSMASRFLEEGPLLAPSVDQAVPAAAVSPPIGSWLWVALVLWFLGLCFILASSVIRFAEMKRLSAAGRAPNPALREGLKDACGELGVKRVPRLIMSVDISSPVLFGFRRPTILFPAALFEELSQPRLRHVLLHEVAHVRRLDVAIQYLLLALQAVFWPNLLLGRVRRRLAHLQDLHADAVVTSQLRQEERDDYRETLIGVARFAFGLGVPKSALSLGFVTRPGLIRERLEGVSARPRFPRTLRFTAAGLASIVLALLIFPMGSGSAVSASTDSLDMVQSRIAGIRFVGYSGKDPTGLLRFLEERPGMVFSTGTLAKDVRALASSGLFDGVRAVTAEGEDGVFVEFQLMEPLRLIPAGS